MARISKQELEWRAQDDARILAQYQEILLDKARLKNVVVDLEKHTIENGIDRLSHKKIPYGRISYDQIRCLATFGRAGKNEVLVI